MPALQHPVSADGTVTFCKSVFAQPALVVESYSDPGRPAQQFYSPDALVAFIEEKRGLGIGAVQFSIQYADTLGSLELRRVALDPSKCDGATFRTVAEGWGLIHVRLVVFGEDVVGSYVSANSEGRAKAWFSTSPELGDPQRWDWSAVASHLKRLRRALARVI